MDNATYLKLLEIRKSANLKLAQNSYWRPEVILRPYQIQAVVNLYMCRRFILGEDCGLGKTPEILATYTALLSKDPQYKLMVVCPSSAMYQWANEVNKFCIGVTSQIVESVDTKITDGFGKKENLKSFDSREHQFNLFESKNKNILIFNYNTLCSDFHVIKEFMLKYKFFVVFDEATAFKNKKTKAFLYASEVSKITDRVVGVTATPVKNNLLEIWTIYRIVLPGLLGSIEAFKKNYCLIEKIQLWKGKGKRGKTINKIVGYKNLEFFKKTIDPFFLGRKKADVAKDLPSIVAKEVMIKMNPQQEMIYNDALAGFLDLNKFKATKSFMLGEEPPSEIEECTDIKYIDKLTALIYCQQICNSPYTVGIEAPSAKEDALLEMLETELAGEKVVIYSRFKKMIDRLEKLVEEKLKVKCLKITGDIKSRDREDAKLLFNTSPDHNIMFINSAAKEAVNLQSSGYLLFFDLPFSYGDFLQIIGRIHRIGSTKEKIFLIYFMCLGTIDEKVYKILSSKKELFDLILNDSAVGAIKSKDAQLVHDLFEDILQEVKKLS